MVDQTLHYGDLRIPYKVLFPDGKAGKLSIHIQPDGALQVEAPPGTPLEEIKAAVNQRARWIHGHMERARRRRAYLLRREYVSGESHYYLGRRYLLKVRASRGAEPSVRLRRGQFQVVAPAREPALVRRLLWNWYRVHAAGLFERRLATLCSRLSWVQQPPAWRLLAMKRQWGSCSPRGELRLNPHLVKAPSPCIDYVLLHELCHLKHHDHSAGFYRLLAKEMPGWETEKKRLDDMAEVLLNV